MCLIRDSIEGASYRRNLMPEGRIYERSWGVSIGKSNACRIDTVRGMSLGASQYCSYAICYRLHKLLTDDEGE